jgi:hypothetical protein
MVAMNKLGAVVIVVVLAACTTNSDDESLGWGQAGSDGTATIDVPAAGSGANVFALLATGAETGAYSITASATGSAVLTSVIATPSSVTLADNVAEQVQVQVQVGSDVTSGTGVAYVTATSASDASNSVTATLIVVVQ